MHTMTIQLNDELNGRLEELCRRTKRSKVEWQRVALENLLESQFVSAYDGLVGLESTVDLPFDARDHKRAFKSAMLKRHA